MKVSADDPWLVAQVEAALAPYAGRLPSADLQFMRESLRELMAQGDLSDLAYAAKERQVDESGSVAFRTGVALPNAPPRPTGTDGRHGSSGHGSSGSGSSGSGSGHGSSGQG